MNLEIMLQEDVMGCYALKILNVTHKNASTDTAQRRISAILEIF